MAAIDSGPEQNATTAAGGQPDSATTKLANLRLIVIGAVLAIGLGGALVWRTWAKPPTPARPTIKSTFMCVAEGCGFQEARGLTVGESLPLQCPKCGQKTLYVSNACSRCGTANVMKEVQGLAGPTQCSQCGAEIRHEE